MRFQRLQGDQQVVGKERSRKLLYEASSLNHQILSEHYGRPHEPPLVHQLQLQLDEDGREDREFNLGRKGHEFAPEAYQSPTHHASPTEQDYHKWLEFKKDMEGMNKCMLSMCEATVELVDLVDEGERFAEHTHLDQFLNKVETSAKGEGNNQEPSRKATPATESSETGPMSPPLPSLGKKSCTVRTLEGDPMPETPTMCKNDYSKLLQAQYEEHQRLSEGTVQYHAMLDDYFADQALAFDRLCALAEGRDPRAERLAAAAKASGGA